MPTKITEIADNKSFSSRIDSTTEQCSNGSAEVTETEESIGIQVGTMNAPNDAKASKVITPIMSSGKNKKTIKIKDISSAAPANSHDTTVTEKSFTGKKKKARHCSKSPTSSLTSDASRATSKKHINETSDTKTSTLSKPAKKEKLEGALEKEIRSEVALKKPPQSITSSEKESQLEQKVYTITRSNEHPKNSSIEESPHKKKISKRLANKSTPVTKKSTLASKKSVKKKDLKKEKKKMPNKKKNLIVQSSKKRKDEKLSGNERSGTQNENTSKDVAMKLPQQVLSPNSKGKTTTVTTIETLSVEEKQRASSVEKIVPATNDSSTSVGKRKKNSLKNAINKPTATKTKLGKNSAVLKKSTTTKAVLANTKITNFFSVSKHNKLKSSSNGKSNTTAKSSTSKSKILSKNGNKMKATVQTTSNGQILLNEEKQNVTEPKAIDAKIPPDSAIEIIEFPLSSKSSTRTPLDEKNIPEKLSVYRDSNDPLSYAVYTTVHGSNRTPKSHKIKYGYKEMAIEAIFHLADRRGSSLSEISKAIFSLFPETNLKSMKCVTGGTFHAVKRAVERKEFVKDETSRYRLAPNFRRKIKAIEKRRNEKDYPQKPGKKKQSQDKDRKAAQDKRKKMEEEKKRIEKEEEEKKRIEKEEKEKAKEKERLEKIKRRKFPMEDLELMKEDEELGVKLENFECVQLQSLWGWFGFKHMIEDNDIVESVFHLYHIISGDLNVFLDNKKLCDIKLTDIFCVFERLSCPDEDVPLFIDYLFVRILERLLKREDEPLTSTLQARLFSSFKKLSQLLNSRTWPEICFQYMRLMDRFYGSSDLNALELSSDGKSMIKNMGVPEDFIGYLGQSCSELRKAHDKLIKAERLSVKETLLLLNTLCHDLVSIYQVRKEISERIEEMRMLKKKKKESELHYKSVKTGYENTKKKLKVEEISTISQVQLDSIAYGSKAKVDRDLLSSSNLKNQSEEERKLSSENYDEKAERKSTRLNDEEKKTEKNCKPKIIKLNTKEEYYEAEIAKNTALKHYEKGEKVNIVRSSCIGQDRNFCPYYSFKSDPSLIFCQDKDRKWFVVTKCSECDSLLKSLDTRGFRESALHQSLTLIRGKLFDDIKVRKEQEKLRHRRIQIENEIKHFELDTIRRSRRTADTELQKLQNEIVELDCKEKKSYATIENEFDLDLFDKRFNTSNNNPYTFILFKFQKWAETYASLASEGKSCEWITCLNKMSDDWKKNEEENILNLFKRTLLQLDSHVYKMINLNIKEKSLKKLEILESPPCDVRWEAKVRSLDMCTTPAQLNTLLKEAIALSSSCDQIITRKLQQALRISVSNNNFKQAKVLALNLLKENDQSPDGEEEENSVDSDELENEEENDDLFEEDELALIDDSIPYAYLISDFDSQRLKREDWQEAVNSCSTIWQFCLLFETFSKHFQPLLQSLQKKQKVLDAWLNGKAKSKAPSSPFWSHVSVTRKLIWVKKENYLFVAWLCEPRDKTYHKLISKSSFELICLVGDESNLALAQREELKDFSPEDESTYKLAKNGIDDEDELYELWYENTYMAKHLYYSMSQDFVDGKNRN